MHIYCKQKIHAHFLGLFVDPPLDMPILIHHAHECLTCSARESVLARLHARQDLNESASPAT